MLITLGVASFWNNLAFLKESVHLVLDPIFYPIFNYSLILGMIVFVSLIMLIITIVQKFTVDHSQLREIKERQKAAQAEVKKYKHDPQKMMEIQKEQFANLGEDMKKQMTLMIRPIMYTSIPVLLFFRWIGDYFILIDNNKILGMSWIIVYFILSMIASIIFRKIFKIG